MISLKQFTAAQVTAKDDALLYEWLSQRAACVFVGCEVTSLGANQMRITAGRGIILGRTFEVQQEDFTAQLADRGENWNGRVYIEIDLSNTTQPIAIKTVAAASLPELTQENINEDGTSYQMELCTYEASDVDADNVKMSVANSRVMGWMQKDAYGGSEDGVVARADTATKLADARNIGLAKFDGSKDVTLKDIGAEPAFQKNSAFNKNFGSGAGTVCQGNDTRLSNARRASNITMQLSGTTLRVTYS